jgi:streptogramin lyase
VKLRLAPALLALLFVVDGCSAGQHGYVPPVSAENGPSLAASAAPPNGQLLVINGAVGSNPGSIAIYNLRTSRLIRTLSSGIINPVSIASDAAGNLYVANAPASGNGSIAVFAPGFSTPTSSITAGIDRPSDVKIDSAGELVVANQGSNSIAYYAAGATSPSRTIAIGIQSPQHIAFDNLFGWLWVLNTSTVTDYTPGTGAGADKVRARFTLPSSMEAGPNDNVYVADRAGAASGYGDVQIVSIETGKVSGRVTTGVHSPAALAFDSDRRLYVANDFSPGSVTVYAGKANALQRKITQGVARPDALAIAGGGWLYVANNGRGHANIAVYPPGKSSPAFRITEGVTSPVGLRVRAGPANAPSAVVFPVPGSPSAIALGPDGNMWFVESGTLASIDRTGSVNALKLPQNYQAPQQDSITRGADGAMWFEAEYSPTSYYGTPYNQAIGVARIMPDGTGFAFYPLQGITYSGAGITGMTEGPDGAVWFALGYSDVIDRITPSGNITSFVPPHKARPWGIVTGPDRALWFTEPCNDNIARLTTSGQFTEYKLPGVQNGRITVDAFYLAVGSDGALWSHEDATDRVVRITTAGKITTSGNTFGGGDYRLQGAVGFDKGFWYSNGGGLSSVSIKTLKPEHDLFLALSHGDSVGGVAADGIGNLWFTVLQGNSVVRVTP